MKFEFLNGFKNGSGAFLRYSKRCLMRKSETTLQIKRKVSDFFAGHPEFSTVELPTMNLGVQSQPRLLSPTFIVLLTGQPEAGVEVTQHVLVLARLPDVVDGVGQLLPLDPGQLFLLHRREGHVGGWVPGVRGRGLWAENDGELVMRRIKVFKK